MALVQDYKDTKKTDIKLTPTRPNEQTKVTQDPLQTPLPESPKSLNDENSDAELQLIAAITARPSLSQSFAKGQSHSEINTSSEGSNEPDIVMSDIISTADEDAEPASISERTSEQPILMDEKETEDAFGFYVNSYPENYPLDWSLSPANNYQQPLSKVLDAVDSSLLPENERRLSLCLPPFSKEFYITPGYSKLQVPDDYLELIRVLVWHNSQCEYTASTQCA